MFSQRARQQQPAAGLSLNDATVELLYLYKYVRGHGFVPYIKTFLCLSFRARPLSAWWDLQVSGAACIGGQGEVLALQASLFQAQLELQAGQRGQRQAGRTQEDLSRALQRSERDLQGALQHRRETERHNQVGILNCYASVLYFFGFPFNESADLFDACAQDLQLALEEARSALQEREEQRREAQGERARQEEESERTIRELRTSLQTKGQLIEVRHS